MGFFGNMAVFSVSGGPIPTPPVSGSRTYSFPEYPIPLNQKVIGRFDVVESVTLAGVKAFADWVADSTMIIIEIRKNSPGEGNNILLSTLRIDASSGKTNGLYQSTLVSSFSSASLAEGDILYAVVTSDWGYDNASGVEISLIFS